MNSPEDTWDLMVSPIGLIYIITDTRMDNVRSEIASTNGLNCQFK